VVQEERIWLRWEVLELDNTAIQKARENGKTYNAELLNNGDTHKQLLVRSRYKVFKSKTKWTKSQIKRGDILFKLNPSIEKASNLAQGLCNIFENNTNKDVARLKLAQ
jgi:transposase